MPHLAQFKMDPESINVTAPIGGKRRHRSEGAVGSALQGSQKSSDEISVATSGGVPST